MYTPEQIDFIREVAPGRYNGEITKMFNTRFGLTVTEEQVKNLKANHKIKSGTALKRRTPPPTLFTEEQAAFIKQHLEGISNQKLTDLINETFGTSFRVDQVKAWKSRHKLSSGLKGTEGVAPKNKGTKGVYNVGGNKTSFKKGQRSHNYVPVGSERVNGDDYVDIKVADPNKWRGKHLLVWEAHHGHPVPKGHVVIFGDRNRRNFDPDNLILVSRAQLAVMNRKNLIQNDADLTRSGVIIADIYQKISQRKKE
jgi:hypothetical protein